ncbi:MAG: protein phosphatase 2C domain-containing protein [Culturomica sp.]|nr:protein phosphatase 2C domain-containing protein [Culturomica sp.]
MIDIISRGSFSEQGRRDNNEDAIATTEDGRCFIVCDGMGGHGHGEIASRTVADSMAFFFQNLPGPANTQNMQPALEYAIEMLDKEDNFDDERKMGTTAVLAVLTESAVLVGHVGDSRLYHIRPEEGLLFRTKDHSQVQQWIDAEILTEEEAAVHPKKNLITRCIQPHSSQPIVMEIDERTDLKSGDWFFLCTDGVTDALTDGQIVEIIANHGTAEEKVEQIKSLCAERSKDNYSGFLLEIKANIVTPPDKKQCRVCGVELNPETLYCPACGSSVYDNSQTKKTRGVVPVCMNWLKERFPRPYDTFGNRLRQFVDNYFKEDQL